MRKLISLLLSVIISFTAVGQEFSKTQIPYIPTNYVFNSGIENGLTGYGVYNDGDVANPVDGIGGTATVSVSTTTALPLVGGRSLVFTKPAGSSHRGQGLNVKDIRIDDQAKGKVIRTSLDYEITSGTYVTGDLAIWIYDVTNARWIQPSSYLIEGSTLKESKFVEWQSSIDSNLYRLVVHVTSTSTSGYTLKFDSFSVGLTPKIYGSVATDWELVTSGASVNWTNSTLTLYKRRVGDSVEYQGKINFTGTPSGGGLRITLPHHYQSRVISSGFNNNLGYLLDASASQDYTLFGGLISSNEFSVYRVTNSPPIMGSYSSVTPTAPVTVVSGDSISFKIDALPVQGWSSSQQLSSDADTRVISFKATGASNTITQGAVNTVVNPTVVFDDVGGYNASTGEYTVKVNGVYRVSAGVRRISASGQVNNELSLEVYKNGFSNSKLGQYLYPVSASLYVPINGSTLIKAVAGDVLKLVVEAGAFTGSGDLNGSFSYFTIERISGPSQIAASESVIASYWLSANFNASTTTPINFDSKEFDSHNSVTVSPTAWRFTAPISGTYNVASLIYITTAAANFYAYKNGSSYKFMGYTDSGTGIRAINSTPIKLLQGEYIDIRPDANMTVRGGVLNNNVTAYISVNRIGNY